MRRRIVSVLITIAAALTFCLRAKAVTQPELIPMHATAYCLDGVTASGEPVRKGICASGRKELFGKTIILYQRLPDGSIGRGLGIYEVKDTGCKPNVIDIWRPNLDECQDVMDAVYEDGCKGKIFVQVIEESEG